MSGTTGDYKWQRVTTSDNEWQRVTANDNEETENSDEWQRMTASAITNENEWECVKWKDFVSKSNKRPIWFLNNFIQFFKIIYNYYQKQQFTDVFWNRCS